MLIDRHDLMFIFCDEGSLNILKDYISILIRQALVCMTNHINLHRLMLSMTFDVVMPAQYCPGGVNCPLIPDPLAMTNSDRLIFTLPVLRDQ